LAAVAATALVFGYRTKVALFASWLLLLSLHGRFPLLTQGGDALLRCMLLWSLFLPLEGRRKVERSSAGPTVASFGSVAFILQLSVMYFFSALLKTGVAWRSDFSATYYALSIDHFTSELGYLLLEYPRLLQALTVAAMLLESVGPLLLLIPCCPTWVRLAVPLSFIGFHLGLAATMDLGTFPWICIMFWCVLLPPRAWDALEHGIVVARECFGIAVGRTSRPVAEGPGGPSCKVNVIGSFASNLIAAFLISYVVLMNVNRLVHPRAPVGAPPLSYLGQVLGLDQYWNMFSPEPYRYGGWLRIEGETAAGREVNLYRPDEPLHDAKPANVSATYPTQYWRRCLVTMYEFQERAHIEGGLRYFARHWNQTHTFNEQVVAARLVHMIEHTPPPADNRRPRTVERKVLGELRFDATSPAP
jgi:hypothetical protein